MLLFLLISIYDFDFESVGFPVFFDLTLDLSISWQVVGH